MTPISADFFIAGRRLGAVVVAMAWFSSTVSGFAFVGGAMMGALLFLFDQIVKAIQMHHGNKTKAAKELGVSLRGLYKKLNKYGMQ